MSELWQRIRQARRFADLTQEQLAIQCGVSRGAVALWEAAESEHRTKPTTDHLITLAKSTGVPLQWLMNDAADINEVWRLSAEFRDNDWIPRPPAQTGDVLPDLRQNGHLFVFAKTAEQIEAKLQQLANEPDALNKHLILIGASANVRAVATPADALSAVVQVLTQAS